MSATVPVLRRRPARVIPSVLMCLAVLVPVGWLVWAIVVRFSEGTWPAPVAAGAPAVLATPLSHPGVLATAVVLSVLGLVLLVCALAPGRHRHGRLRVDERLHAGSQESVLTHHGLANLLRTRTGRLDGVESVTARVTDRRVRLDVRTPLRETGEVVERVRTVAQDTVERIPLVGPPAVTVRPGRSRR